MNETFGSLKKPPFDNLVYKEGKGWECEYIKLLFQLFVYVLLRDKVLPQKKSFLNYILDSLNFLKLKSNVLKSKRANQTLIHEQKMSLMPIVLVSFSIKFVSDSHGDAISSQGVKNNSMQLLNQKSCQEKYFLYFKFLS